MKASHFKAHVYAKIALLVVLLLASTATASAVDIVDVSGTMGATQVTGEQEWHLVGDLTLSDVIEVTEGSKLTIINTSGAPVTIHRAEGSKSVFFRNLGEMHLGDNNSERIILDSGSTIDWDDSEHKLMPESSKAKEVQTYPLIAQKGLMYMNNVTITNFCGLAFNPVLLFQTRNKTFIDNCLFEKCFGAQVACILVNPADPEPDPKDCAISISNTTFRHCEGGTEYDDNLGRGYNYSGIIRNIGVSTSNILLSNVVIEDNYLAGGGIVCNLSRKGKLTVDGCSIRRNRVGSYGAGIWTEGAFEAVGAPTIIENNYAAKGGSGFTITTYGGEYKFTANRTYNFNDKLIIRNNRTAGIGGGVCVLFNNKTSLEAGSTFDINFNGAIIENNSADVSGGGIYFSNSTKADQGYTFNTYLNGGKISDNTAPIGAGIYAETIDVGHSSSGDDVCTINGNHASEEGAGIYIKGANISLNNADVSSNEATTHGGGIYLEGGSLTMASGDIHNNICGQNGGGVYITNTAVNYNSSSFSGGKIYANNAKNGGGICVDGNVNFTTTATNIEGNNATNGGGICVINGAKMLYQSGLIRNNSAKTTSDMTGQTAYQKSVDQVAGIGGGVFVANNASLSFNVTDNLFGLYGNTATNGADDIFANGNGTSIALPDVSAMNLTGYSINLPPNSLYWVEDYIPNDEYYSAGTQIMGANYPGSLSFKNWRYRYALEHDDYTFYTVDGNQTLTCYTALALGYQIVYITVTKSGMKAGDTAMFCIRSQGAADDYLTFMLSDRDKVVAADGSVTWQKRVRLFSGTWTVAEVDAWTWAYNPTSDTSYTRTVNSASSAADLTFAFTNASKADAPPHAEDSIVNDLGL